MGLISFRWILQGLSVVAGPACILQGFQKTYSFSFREGWAWGDKRELQAARFRTPSC